MRNRAMEALETLASGEAGVRSIGAVDYVENFFDIIDDRSPRRWKIWSVFTAEEAAALGEVHDLVVEACDATPPVDKVEEFIRSGWPMRIQPVARTALDLMSDRGRFSEEHDEVEPGVPR